MKRYRNTSYIIWENGFVHNYATGHWIKSFSRLLSRNKTRRVLVGLRIAGKSKTLFLHRLLAECFIANPLNLPYVNHLNGNPMDNTLSNLEWSSAADNNTHAMATGLRPTKLSYANVAAIRQDLSAGAPVNDLAVKYRVKCRTIREIRDGISWCF